jgi:hypothetical protein
MNFYCSQSDFLISLMYVSRLDQSASYDIFVLAESISEAMVNDPENGDLKIAGDFHPAQYNTVTYSADELLTDFSTLCGGKCTMFTIEFFGSSTTPMNSRGTPVYAMYEDTAMIACANGLYRPEAITPLVTKAPVDLVEAYYTCKLNVTVAATRAVGIAAGSAALYAGVVLNGLLFIVIFVYNRANQEKILNPAIKKQNMENDVAMLKSEAINFKSETVDLRNEIASLKSIVERLNNRT